MSFFTLNPKSNSINSGTVVEVADSFPNVFKPLYYLRVQDKITLEDIKKAEDGLVGAERLEYLNEQERLASKKIQEAKEWGIHKSFREFSTVMMDLISFNFLDYTQEQKNMQMVYLGVLCAIIAFVLIFLNIPM